MSAGPPGAAGIMRGASTGIGAGIGWDEPAGRSAWASVRSRKFRATAFRNPLISLIFVGHLQARAGQESKPDQEIRPSAAGTLRGGDPGQQP